MNFGSTEDLFLRFFGNQEIPSVVPSLSSRNKTFIITVKIYAKAEIKFFWPSLIFLDFFTLFQIFCPELQVFTVEISYENVGKNGLTD